MSHSNHRADPVVAIAFTSLLQAAVAGADPVEGQRLFDEETFGGNGRTCVTCHSVGTGTISPTDVQERLAADPTDPLFLHDALDDGFSGTTRISEHATIRVGKKLPREADGDPTTVTLLGDPNATHVTLLRGVPSTINTPALDPALMYDRRDNTLECQALGAIMGHGVNTIAPTDAELDDIADFQQTDPRFFSWRPGFPRTELMDYADACGRPTSPVSGCPDIDDQPSRPQDTTIDCEPAPPVPGLPDCDGPELSESERRGCVMFKDVPINPPVTGTEGICSVCHSGAMLNKPNGLSPHLVGTAGGVPPPENAPTATAGVSERNLLGNPVYTFVVTRGPQQVEVMSPDPGTLLSPEFGAPFPPDFEKNFFKIPQLWGVAGTAPYFHDNSAKDLRQLAEHYSWFYANISPFEDYYPDGLSPEDQQGLVDFLLLLPEPGRGVQLLAGVLGLLGLHGLRRGRPRGPSRVVRS